MAQQSSTVKQGAIIGGWVCFALGVLLMCLSLWTIIFYAPLFFAAFVLSIVAMSQRRVWGGILLLLCSMIIPPITFLGLAASNIHGPFSSRTDHTSYPTPAIFSPLPSFQSPTPTPAAIFSALPSSESPTPSEANIPKAVTVDDVLKMAKSKLTYESTSDELKQARDDLRSVPHSSARYPEAQRLLSQIDKYLVVAIKAEEHAASLWQYSEQEDQMGRGITKYATVESQNSLNFDFP